jgi:alanyl-tRNA synthetase
MSQIALKVIEKFEDVYESVKNNKDKIIEEINREEKQFLTTLEK